VPSPPNDDPSPDPGGTYTHGHHESVLRSHRWRTAANSAPHLLPHLRPGQRVLDVGCGPGTITLDLAELVAPGPVLGIDSAPTAVAAARAAGAERPGVGGRATFEVGDVFALDLPDASFDVVHAHQVLQHLADPVAALRELRRVLVPGGLLAVRDTDYGAFVWTPADPRLDAWLDLYRRLARLNGGEPDAGRHLPAWVRVAGFADLTVTGSTWVFASPEDRSWWGGTWAERAVDSSFAEAARSAGLADAADLAAVADAFRRWLDAPDGSFVVPHVEVVARR
jgi:SAM-dependent methyltransferase